MHCLVHALKCILANPRRLVYGYQFVQNVALDRFTSFNKRCQKWTSSEINISYFDVIYGNFHMLYFVTHTFSLIVFPFVKRIFCFPFLWVWKGTGNKVCSFKSYICCSILNYSWSFLIFFSFEATFSCTSCDMKLMKLVVIWNSQRAPY